MLFNTLIQMEHNFHKINSFFPSIDHLILTTSAQQHWAQARTRINELEKI